MAKGQWHWQERGTAWKGIGIYHVTLTVTNRQPILGDLVIPNDDPSNAYINESPLGKDLVQCVIHWHEHYPEIRVLQFCLMPDHLHVIVHVQRTMPYGIMTVVRGLWQAAKKLGRAYSAEKSLSFNPNIIRDKEQTSLDPIFVEMPFVRVLVHNGQLETMYRYVRMNPQRLATKRLKPEYFRVQEEIEIADNGFRDYYKPQDSLFDAVAKKQVLILSPWEYDPNKKGVSRAECIEMNKMAEEICAAL